MAAVAGSPAGAARPTPVAVAPPISLGQFVKRAGLVVTGGEAKQLVMAGSVAVNGEVETHRGRKLKSGDIVESRGEARQVVLLGGDGPEGGVLGRGALPPASPLAGSGRVSSSIDRS